MRFWIRRDMREDVLARILGGDLPEWATAEFVSQRRRETLVLENAFSRATRGALRRQFMLPIVHRNSRHPVENDLDLLVRLASVRARETDRVVVSGSREQMALLIQYQLAYPGESVRQACLTAYGEAFADLHSGWQHDQEQAEKLISWALGDDNAETALIENGLLEEWCKTVRVTTSGMATIHRLGIPVSKPARRRLPRCHNRDRVEVVHGFSKRVTKRVHKVVADQEALLGRKVYVGEVFEESLRRTLLAG